MIETSLDLALGLLLLGLAGGALHARSLYAGVLLFVAFGLVLALVWARLGAADLALAEAAIGAGLTGTLLFAALARRTQPAAAEASGVRRLLAACVLLPLLALLMGALPPLAERATPLPGLVEAHLAQSGVAYPVTAVLLNFRAWDTLLELGVLALALLGAGQLGAAKLSTGHPWTPLRGFARRLAPLVMLASGYLLWRGGTAPGGAFQAGALLAGGLVLLRLAGLSPLLTAANPWLRLASLAALALFVLVAGLTALAGDGWLHYPPSGAKALILALEGVAVFAIAIGLALLVVGEEARAP